MALRTPLYDIHVQSGGKMVDFAGWDLPIQYSSPLDEHRWVRSHVGIFDISHMGRLALWGPNIPQFLEGFLTASLQDLLPGQCRYSLAIDPQGKVLDDVYVFCITADHYLVVVNAANREAVITQRFSSIPESITFKDLTASTAMIALQGPKSQQVWSDLFNDQLPEPRNLVWHHNEEWIISRTGYTGEFGVEIILPAHQSLTLWEKLTTHEFVKPAGLAARDSLRFEAGYMLFGHELTNDIYPSETNLSWSIRKERLDQLPNKDILDKAKARYRLIWFNMNVKAVPRQGYEIFLDAHTKIGAVASGMFAPTLDGFYGNGLVESSSVPEIGKTLYINIRGTLKEAIRIKPLIM
jgi:glycine cleavage system T protein